MPMAFRDGVANLGGIGWWRGLVMSVLAGPPQAMIAYSGFILVPLGHGTTIQPACAALFGLILATVVLRERATVTRVLGGVTIIAGLVVFGAESLATIGTFGRRRRPVVRHRRIVLGDIRHAAALLPHVGDPRDRRGRRAVGRRLRAALCDLRRLRRPGAAEPCRKSGCKLSCKAFLPARCRSICSRVR